MFKGLKQCSLAFSTHFKIKFFGITLMIFFYNFGPNYIYCPKSDDFQPNIWWFWALKLILPPQIYNPCTNLEAKNNYFWVKKYGWDQNYIFGWPKSLISKPEYYFYEYDKIEIKNAIKKGKIKQNKDKNISNEKYCIEYEVAYEGHLSNCAS